MRIIGIVLAILLHAGFILFGGLVFNASKDKVSGGTTVVVALDGNDVAVKKKEEPKETVRKTEDMKTQEEKPPDADTVIREIQESAAAKAPGLDELSMSAIENLLSGKGPAGGSDFGLGGGSLAGGGQIGGKGPAGSLESKIEKAFNPNEIDQKPRVVFQAPPTYPAELRGKKVEGVVSVVFIVDASGKVTNQRAEKSSNAAFETPALSAVKQWRFEPAIKGGQRVACKMRVSIRFQES